MELKTTRTLRGPNIWMRATVLEVVVDFRAEGDFSATQWKTLRDRLRRLFPAVLRTAQTHEHEAIRTSPASTGLALADLLASAALALQNAAGSLVEFARVSEMQEHGVCKLAVQYREEPVGRMALQTALQLLAAAVEGREFDVEGPVYELRSLDQNIRLGPSTGSIVRAAQARGIPARRLNERSLVQLGQGCQQHRILAAETDRTSAVAEAIVQDKELTKQLLRAIGVPVPAGRPVSDAEDAWQVAQEIGLPVVVKPKDGNQGRGVAVNLTTREQVQRAYAAAREEEDEVLVEKFAAGADYRVLIIDGKLVAAARREPPQVMGDGRRTIAELVAETNLDPRRGEDHATPLSKIPLDEIADAVLASQGLSVSAVPAAGQVVLLRRNANLSTGGSAADATDLVHPEVAARCIEAARMVGLDIAGIDVVASDISRPLEDQGGMIIEINAAPGLRMHLEPSSGKGRPVGEAIVDSMFAPGSNGRIPVVAVTGVNGKTTTTRLISHILRTFGKRVGMTCTDGVYLNDRRIDTGDCSGPKSARTVLANPAVEAAVLETARGGVLREGLGFDQCDVAVVTNIGEGDHLGLNGIDTLEQLARVKRVIVESVAPHGCAVLNAEDPLTAAMAAYCPGQVVLFARKADHPALLAHRERGGKAVFVQQNAIFAAEGRWEAKIVALQSVSLTFGGLIGFQVENTLAATAAAWNLGIPIEVIRLGLESFINNAQRVPARFNCVQFRGTTIIIDYGHNSSALLALLDAFQFLPHERRLIVYTAAGDRRDEDIIRQAELIAQGFDELVLYEDQCTRGRADGEVIRLMREGLQKGTRLRHVDETRGEMIAIEIVLRKMQPGDLVLIQADQVEEAIRFVERHLASLPEESVREPRPQTVTSR